MFWLILLGLILIGGIVFCIYERDAIFFIPMCGILIITMIVGTLIGGCFGACIEANEVYETTKTPIVALADNVGTEGSSFLGSGTIKSSLYYYYMTENDNGSKVVNKIGSNYVELYDDETETPYILTVKARNSNGFVRFFFFTERSRTEIHIPPSSIKYDFCIDLG